MNIIYYLLGSFLYAIFTVLFNVYNSGSFTLNQPTLIDLAIRSVLAGVAFYIADYLLRRKNP